MGLWRKSRRTKRAARHRLSLRKRIVFTLLANLLVLVAVAGIGEIVCRLFAPQDRYGSLPSGMMEMLRFSDDVYLGWELKPGVLDHNSTGLRGAEVAREKPAHVRRIAILGDSVTYGLHTTAVEAYPSVLRSRLDETGIGPVEVLNFGVPGYNTFQEYTLLQTRALRFDPDLVVMTFTADDVETSPVIINVDGEMCLLRNHFEGIGLLNNSAHWSVFRASHFYRFLYKQMVVATAARGAEFDAVYVRPDVQWENVLRTAELCRREQTPLLLVLSPFLLPPEGDVDRAEFERYQEAMDQIRRLARESGIELLDLGPLYAEHTGEMKVHPPDDHEHLNAEGHRLVAEALLEKVLTMHKNSQW
ncbi:MAG: SGNH/GDSL hydrolase family protein [Candidatus Nealsonbacteria bacterium]|nr:SGNH/GDSL hydrolase family protein [Candidatus Nealsonbacteria bacterium]